MATKAKKSKSKTASAADLLGSLNDAVDAAPPATSAASKSRLVDLPADVKDDFVGWVEAKLLFELVKTRVSNLASEVTEACKALTLDHIWSQGSFPSNPKLKEGDVEARFTFQKRFRVSIPAKEGVSPEDQAIEMLVDAGLSQENAENLVENEFDCSPQTGTRPFTELVEGHYGEEKEWIEATDVEKEAGRKLLAFLTAVPSEGDEVVEVEPLTAQERQAVVRKTNRVVVKKGFVERVREYVTTRDQLTGVFNIVFPTHCYPSHAKVADETTKTGRLVKQAADILGVEAIKAE